MKHLQFSITLVLFVSVFSISSAQIDSFYVNPLVVDPTYDVLEDNHLVYNPSSTPLNKLLLFVPGTDAPTGFYSPLLEFASNLGYHVIAICYDNSVNTGTFFNYPDSNAFKNFRQEVWYGTPVCPDVNIDTNNSIYTRVVELLNYLSISYPTKNWGQFLNMSNEPNWPIITIGGHSQGAGHSFFLAQRSPVERALAFSGPNDYSNYHNKPAFWLSDASVTPKSKYYVYLNLNDDFAPQFANAREITQTPINDTVNVDINVHPYGNSQILYSKVIPYTNPSPQFAAHNYTASTKSDGNFAVWAYLLGLSWSPTTNIEEQTTSPHLSKMFPNPSDGIFNISCTAFNGVELHIFDLMGTSIFKKSIQKTDTQIDLSFVASGIYTYQFIRNGEEIERGKLVIK